MIWHLFLLLLLGWVWFGIQHCFERAHKKLETVNMLFGEPDSCRLCHLSIIALVARLGGWEVLVRGMLSFDNVIDRAQ